MIVRTFEERDWPDLVRFYEEFYRPGYILTKRAFFAWSFESPLRPDQRSGQRMVVDGDKIVGIVGVLPWPLQVAGQPVLGEYNINILVDPAYRGQGWAQRLVEEATSGYRYNLVSGYVPRTRSLFERLGTVYHWPMRRLVKCLNVERTQALMDGDPRFQELEAADQAVARTALRDSAAVSLPRTGLEVQIPIRFDAEWDQAWEDIRRGYGFTTWRSSVFLNWRYMDYPVPLYTCLVGRGHGVACGLAVLRIERPSCGPVVRIVDWVATKATRRELLAIVEEVARRQQAIFVDYLAAGAMEERLLAEAGYRELVNPAGQMLLPMDFQPIRHRDTIQALATFRDPADPGRVEFEAGQFYIVKGDGDQDRAN